MNQKTIYQSVIIKSLPASNTKPSRWVVSNSGGMVRRVYSRHVFESVNGPKCSGGSAETLQILRCILNRFSVDTGLEWILPKRAVIGALPDGNFVAVWSH